MARKNQSNPRLLSIFFTIGSNIRRMRGSMTQSNLSAKAGVSRSTIEAVESGRGCSLENLIKMADALGCQPEDLFITDEKRKEISYAHILLMEKIRETLTPK